MGQIRRCWPPQRCLRSPSCPRWPRWGRLRSGVWFTAISISAALARQFRPAPGDADRCAPTAKNAAAQRMATPQTPETADLRRGQLSSAGNATPGDKPGCVSQIPPVLRSSSDRVDHGRHASSGFVVIPATAGDVSDSGINARNPGSAVARRQRLGASTTRRRPGRAGCRSRSSEGPAAQPERASRWRHHGRPAPRLLPKMRRAAARGWRRCQMAPPLVVARVRDSFSKRYKGALPAAA